MVRARLSVADILHRGVVLSLVGVCIGESEQVFSYTVTPCGWEKIIAQREAAGLPTDVVPEKKVEEANEQRWAEAAQAVLRGRGSKTA